MPLIIHFTSLNLYVKGDERDIEELSKKNIKSFFRVSTMAKDKELLVNRDQIVFIEYITEETYQRLNEMMKQEAKKIQKVEIGGMDPLRPRGH